MGDALPQLHELFCRIGKINQEKAGAVRERRRRDAVAHRHIGRRLAQSLPGRPGCPKAVRTMGVVENIVAHEYLPLHERWPVVRQSILSHRPLATCVENARIRFFLIPPSPQPPRVFL